MDRVIITGGNGFIGRHLVKKLLSTKRYSIALISNSSNINDKYIEDRNLVDLPLRFYTADIRDSRAISNIFQDERPEACIHLAAKISVSDSVQNPDETMAINVNGTLNVLEACHKSKVNSFVFASSAAVYGDVKKLPIAENLVLRPLSPYGTSKMLAEQHVLSYKMLKKIQNTISLRIFNVYGNDQYVEADVISRFVKALSNGFAPTIYGDGMQTRDFISVDDVVDAFLLSLNAMEDVENKASYSSVFNLGTGIPTSINQLAQKMIKIFDLDLKPLYKEAKEDKKGIMHSYADTTLARQNLHFVAKKGIETGLREIIEAMT